MIREVRIVTLAILVLLAYSTFIFIDQGSFIFPFPLNEIVFLIVSFQFFLWNRKKSPVLSWMFLLSSFIGMLTSQFFWTMVYDAAHLENFYESIVPDLILLTFYLSLLVTVCYYFVSSKLRQKAVLLILCLIPIVLCIVTGNRHYELLFTIFAALLSTVFKVHQPLNYLWILLAFLNLTKVLMLAF